MQISNGKVLSVHKRKRNNRENSFIGSNSGTSSFSRKKIVEHLSKIRAFFLLNTQESYLSLYYLY
jgi:hypothetical protein